MVNIFRKAIYDACNVTGIPVYDYWVLDKEFPYIIISSIIDDGTEYKLNTKNDFTFTIDIFNKEKGKTAIVNYAEQIKEILMSLDGVGIRTNTRYFSDVEPNVMHAVLTVTFTKYN